MLADLLCVVTVRHICLVQPALSQLLNCVLPRWMTWLIVLRQNCRCLIDWLGKTWREGKQAFLPQDWHKNLRAIWAGCVDQTESDRTGQLFSLFYLTKRKQRSKKRSKLCFYATELVKNRYRKVSVRVVVDLSTSLFRKALMISVGSFLVCTQLRLDTLHYNKLKAKEKRHRRNCCFVYCPSPQR
jgi:hypothetical protein